MLLVDAAVTVMTRVAFPVEYVSGSAVPGLVGVGFVGVGFGDGAAVELEVGGFGDDGTGEP